MGITIIAIAGLVIALIKFRQKYIDAIGQLKQRGKDSRQLGINEIKGGINEILGTFALLTQYDDIILLSTTAGNASLDHIGVKKDSLDFIEIKTKGAPSTKGENKIKRLVVEKKVNYRIVDVELPKDFKTSDRSNNSKN